MFAGVNADGLDFMTWMATEGGRKCPQCGRYAKTAELGNLSRFGEYRGGRVHVSVFGHLPGFGCNRVKDSGNERA